MKDLEALLPIEKDALRYIAKLQGERKLYVLESQVRNFIKLSKTKVDWKTILPVLENIGAISRKIYPHPDPWNGTALHEGSVEVALHLAWQERKKEWEKDQPYEIAKAILLVRQLERIESDTLGVKEIAVDKNTKLSFGEKALAVLVKHPEWNDARIARDLGCNQSTLSRCQQLKDARKVQKQEKFDHPRGFKDEKTGELEAWDAPHLDIDDDE